MAEQVENTPDANTSDTEDANQDSTRHLPGFGVSFGEHRPQFVPQLMLNTGQIETEPAHELEPGRETEPESSSTVLTTNIEKVMEGEDRTEQQIAKNVSELIEQQSAYFDSEVSEVTVGTSDEGPGSTSDQIRIELTSTDINPMVFGQNLPDPEHMDIVDEGEHTDQPHNEPVLGQTQPDTESMETINEGGHTGQPHNEPDNVQSTDMDVDLEQNDLIIDEPQSGPSGTQKTETSDEQATVSPERKVQPMTRRGRREWKAILDNKFEPTTLEMLEDKTKTNWAYLKVETFRALTPDERSEALNRYVLPYDEKYWSLDNRGKEAYTNVCSEQIIEGEKSDEITRCVIRSCYSRVLDKEISLETWENENLFSEYYLEKTNEIEDKNKVLMVKATAVKGKDRDGFEMYCIRSHTETKKNRYGKAKMEWFLLQFKFVKTLVRNKGVRASISLIEEKEMWDKGEISWVQSKEIINEPNGEIGPILGAYMKGIKITKSFWDAPLLGKGTSRKTAKTERLIKGLPDIRRPLIKSYGRLCDQLGIQLMTEKPGVFNANIDEFESLNGQLFFFNRFVILCNKVLKTSTTYIVPNIVGSASLVDSENKKIKGILNDNNLASILKPKSFVTKLVDAFANKKALVIGLMITYNEFKIEVKDGEEQEKHCYVGIFRKMNKKTEYFIFDPTPNEVHTYRSVPKVMTEIRDYMARHCSNQPDIRRAFGYQGGEKNCYTEVWRYACLVADGFEFDEYQNYMYDSELLRSERRRKRENAKRLLNKVKSI